MRLPRMTTQRWMIAVAVLALAMTAMGMRWRRDQYLRIAAYHKRARSLIGEGIGIKSGTVDIWMRYDPSTRRWRTSSFQEATYHSRMGEKYERAARYPWLPVEPDPPPPK